MTPHGMDLAALQEAIRTGDLTRGEIVEDHLRQIARVNPHTRTYSEVRADEVRAEAARADAERGRTIVGSLDGAVVSMKDTFAVAGLRRTDGLVAHADRVADRDDLLVARVRAAGGLIAGHANVPDLCTRWNTVSGLWGTARNPRDLSRTVGGSSGGDAGNVAGGMATVGFGQDLGGSVRVPAVFCEVYGLRPSPGVVPNVAAIPMGDPTVWVQEFSTNGQLGRSVEDVAAAFDAVRGHTGADPASVPVVLEQSRVLPRVAVLRDQTGAALDPVIEQRLDETVAMLRDAGYEVVDGVFPELRRAPEVWAEILGTELVNVSLPRVGHLVEETCRQHMEQMHGAFDLGDSAAAYERAWTERGELLRRYAAFAEEFALVVAPVAGMLPPPVDFDHLLDAAATMRLFDRMRCVMWVNLLGLPSLALPNGIQVVGRRFADLDVLAAGRAVARALGPASVATWEEV